MILFRVDIRKKKEEKYVKKKKQKKLNIKWITYMLKCIIILGKILIAKIRE